MHATDQHRDRSILSAHQLLRHSTGRRFGFCAMSRNWKFCPYTGDLLVLDAFKGTAYCRKSQYVKALEELQEVKLVTHTDMEEFRRRNNLVPLVKLEIGDDITNARTRAKVDEECPKCGNFGLEYYTMQLRSADEGQTVFYECEKCKYKYSQNT